MIAADRFIRAAGERGFTFYTGVPCSYLTPFINYVLSSDELRYVGAANEGDAVAIAAGATLGGLRSVAMFQNSGLGNAVNPLTSLAFTFRIPLLLIPTLRGEPGGPPDEPQHELMGAITGRMLELMRIGWATFPREECEIEPALERACAHLDSERTPYALVMQKGAVGDWPLRGRPERRPTFSAPTTAPPVRPVGTRREVLAAVQRAARPNDVLIATTGYTGRELYAVSDRPNQLYVVGSMGCASSVGLGLALAQAGRHVIVLDGDGALLMRLSALATIGYERPPNLSHLLLDNEAHESTGGQATVAHSIDFCAIAAACGYPHTARVAHLDELGEHLRDRTEGPSFLHVKIESGVTGPLPRPGLAPHEVAERFRAALRSGR